jgi:hypothetical protein
MKGTLTMVLMTAFLLSGCGILGQKKTDEQVVAERGQAWLDALVKKDFKKAWGYTTPGFRSSNDVDVIRRKFGGALSWTAGRFGAVVCVEELRCEAKYEIDYSMPQYSLNSTRVLDSVWIKVDGKWWVYVK